MEKKYSYQTLSAAVKIAYSYSEVIRIINAPHSSYRHIKTEIMSYGINTDHFKKNKVNNNRLTRSSDGKVKRKSIDEILIFIPEGVNNRMARNHLMYAMLSSGLNYLCMMEGCEKPEPIWRGEPCSLDIDHIDGNWRNCKLNNLRFLCGRCHHQVETNSKSRALNPYSLEDFIDKAKQLNKKKKDKKCNGCDNLILRTSTTCTACRAGHSKGKNIKTYPTIADIIKGIKDNGIKPYASSIGFSDNGIRKHLMKNGISPIPKKIKE